MYLVVSNGLSTGFWLSDPQRAALCGLLGSVNRIVHPLDGSQPGRLKEKKFIHFKGKREFPIRLLGF